MRRAAEALVAAACCVAVLAGCTAPIADPVPSASSSPSTDLAAAVASLPRATLTPAQPMRLAKGLLPPTNRWFSGLVFGVTPQPVFPSPLAVSPTSGGLIVTLPTVVATADTIAGPAAGGVALDLGATGFTVTRYDDLTATMTYRDARGPIADVTIAEGWPYVAVTARRGVTVRTSGDLARAADGTWRTTASGTAYAVRAPGADGRGTALTLGTGATAVVYALPKGVPASLLTTGARGVVEGGAAVASLTSRTARTTLRYTTAGGRPTVLMARPGTRPTAATCTSSTVLTIYGRSSACTGTSLTTSVARLGADDALDLGAATPADRAAIAKQLHADVAATPAEPPDTYGGGKWLYRIANLLQLAEALGAETDAAAARKLLDDSLTRWTEVDGCSTRADHCFVYDPVLQGVVGRQASYGSDQFNDHHFHYGYFLYAAAVAVADRPSLETKLAPVVDLLAADVASPEATSSFPRRRVFDAYAGHSWASGFSPFADGNNQESSSEAVNAWNGLALWARVTGNTALEREGVWLLSSEAAAAKRDWLEPDLTAFPTYAHSFVALNWGGKRDSATWFSPDPAAKLAIQLIPMSPAAGYIDSDNRLIRRTLAEARSAGTGLFADYLLMYQALAGGSPRDLLRAAERIPDSGLDSADSRSYLEAWVASR